METPNEVTLPVAPPQQPLQQAQQQQLPAAQRDGAGRFLRGNTIAKLGGRPRGYDIRALAAEMSEKEGIDLPLAIWRVLKTLINAAEKGDVSAAKLVLDRLAMPDEPVAARILTETTISDTELAARVRSIVAYGTLAG